MRNSEFIFRGSVAIISTLLAAIRLAYGWQAGALSNMISTRQADKFNAPLLYFFGLLGAVTSGLYVVAPDGLNWAALSLPNWLRWSGVGLGGLTVGLFFWVHQALGRNWSMPWVIQADQTLVTTGPYRWVRHPMYSTLFVWALAYLLMSANWLIGAGWFGLGLVAVKAAAAEEMALIEKFAAAYRAYRQGTGRFLPRMWR